MIIGVSGKAGAGKDTAAKMLEVIYANPEITFEDYCDKKYKNFVDVQTVHFADMLKETAMTMCILGEDDVNTQYGKKQTIEWLGITVRELLQKLGTCVRQGIDNLFWIKLLFANIEGWDNVIIADVRFPEEVEAIKERGGIILRLERDGAGAGNHISETALDDYNDWDEKIDNNFSLPLLFNQLKQFAKKYPLDL
jgi:hypothetical protein